MLSDADKDALLSKIESEGFEYAITEYGGDILDARFIALRKVYLDASQTLADYLGLED